MNCPNCNSKLKIHNSGKIKINFCDYCWDYLNHEISCENHVLEFVKHKYSNDSIHIKKQCLNCSKMDSKLYPKREIDNWESLPFFIDDITESKVYYESLTEIYNRYNKKRVEFKKETEFNTFINEHSEYLKTKEWKTKRLLVLKRDNNLCQSCLENKAVEVHHKSYRYWKNEPLFELIGVCKVCHEEITKMNREKLNFNFVNK